MTWDVRHNEGVVHLSNVERHDSDPVVHDHRFPEAETDVPLTEYRNEVLRFATLVRDAYFADGERQIADAEDRRLYDSFWAEYDELLDRHARVIRRAAQRPVSG